MTGESKEPNLKEIEKTFVNLFKLRMQELEFPKKRGTNFYRNTDFGKADIDLTISKSYGCLNIVPSVSVRIEEMETLMDEFRFGILKQEPFEFSSARGFIGNSDYYIWTKWQIYYETEIEEIVEEIIERVKQVGLPYIEKYSKPIELYKGLIDRLIYERLATLPAMRYQKILVLTYLLNDYEQFLKEFMTGERVLKNHIQGRFKDYLKLRDFLVTKFEEKKQLVN